MHAERTGRTDREAGRLSTGSERVGTLIRLSDGREFPLGFGSLRVGREKRAGVTIADRTVSRHHADLCYENGRYILYDHSTNGTWVNGSLVAVAQRLRDGDTVKFGEAEFRFVLKAMAKQGAGVIEERSLPGRLSRSVTRIMKRGRQRPRAGAGRTMRLLLLLVLLMIAAGVTLYVYFPDLADRLIARLPAVIRDRLSR